MNKVLLKITAALALITPGLVFAQATPVFTVTFGPNNNIALPAVSNSVLVLLGMLMLIVAWRVLRKGSDHMNKFASVAILTCGLVFTGFGVHQANAFISTVIAGDDACQTGDTESYPGDASVDFESQCPGPIRIIDLNTSDCGVAVDPGTCSVGDLLNNGDVCRLPRCGVPG